MCTWCSSWGPACIRAAPCSSQSSCLPMLRTSYTAGSSRGEKSKHPVPSMLEDVYRLDLILCRCSWDIPEHPPQQSILGWGLQRWASTLLADWLTITYLLAGASRWL